MATDRTDRGEPSNVHRRLSRPSLIRRRLRPPRVENLLQAIKDLAENPIAVEVIGSADSRRVTQHPRRRELSQAR